MFRVGLHSPALLHALLPSAYRCYGPRAGIDATERDMMAVVFSRATQALTEDHGRGWRWSLLLAASLLEQDMDI